MSNEEFIVNLADPDDIRRKLPQARDILAAKERAYEAEEERIRAELAPLASDRDSWRQLVASLQAVSGDDAHGGSSTADDAVTVPVRNPQDLVVEVVDREIRPLRARDVREILRAEGHDLGADSVSNALWYAAIRKDPPLIRQIQRGVYAPLTYKVEEISGN